MDDLDAFINDYVSENREIVLRSIDSYTKQSDQKYAHAILPVRDELMAQKMESHLSSGNAFFAVGTGHLKGIKAKLLAQGHTVDEVPLTMIR